MSDFYSILQWWFVLFLLGIINIPLTSLLFATFKDKGYIFSKTISILLISYGIFILAITHILPFHILTILGVLGVLLAVNIYLFVKQNMQLPKHSLLLLFIAEEILFLGGLFFWSYIRSFEPSIHGLEKFMDYGFVNSILRSEYFPPADMWLTPHSINYYYFGHYITALVTKLSILPSQLTYNLMLATLFAFTLVSGFSIVLNILLHIQKHLIKASLGGLLAGILVSFGGNIHTLYTLFLPYQNESPLPFWKLVFSPYTFPNSYWYPNATRFIYNTIHEFPIYSFVVSDLHGHVIDIPFVFLILATCFILLTVQRVNKLLLVFLSLLLSVMYMTNAWDGLLYMLLVIGIIVIKNFIVVRSETVTQPFSKRKGVFQKTYELAINTIHFTKQFSFSRTFLDAAIVIAGFIVFSLPFSLHFKPFVSGIGVLCSPQFLIKIGRLGPFLFEADHCQHSPWWQLLILYGFFYVVAISLVYFIFRKVNKKTLSDIFILILITFSTFLIIIPEFIYAKDIYPAHYRANTMFKLVYQSFIMLSLVAGYGIIRILVTESKRSVFRFSFFIYTFPLLILVLMYPYFAISSYYGNLTNNKGLDGTAYLKDLHPQDYEAINWLNKHVDKKAVILEAQGDSYTDYARISSNTGLPTVLGWTVHEWLWRGTYDIPSPRIEDVRKMYEGEDIKSTRALFQKYRVEYIYVGALERQKYVSIQEEVIASLGKKVFEKDNTYIIKVIDGNR